MNGLFALTETLRTRLIGVGGYLPDRVVPNAEFMEWVDTTPEWIAERTGIHERRFAADGETTADLATAAAKIALDRAGLKASEIDLIILATATPNRTFPATAATIQRNLGMGVASAFDVQAVCSGFAYALATADNFLRAGQHKTALVIGAETFSRILDFTDRSTCVLFGDGAGAVVLRAEPSQRRHEDRGIFSTHIYSDGRHEDLLYVDGGPSSTQTVGHLRMAGREVFKHAVTNLSQAVQDALVFNNFDAQNVDWFVPHQANLRIIDGVAKKLSVSGDKVIKTVHHHANTSAASIPLALNEAVEDGRIKDNDVVLMEAMGGGFTWGSALLRMG